MLPNLCQELIFHIQKVLCHFFPIIFACRIVVVQLTGRKRLASQFKFTYRYIDDVLSIDNHDLEITSLRCIPLNLRSKTRRRATLLLPTWIYSCQSVGTVNFTLPFTTSVTILICILQNFPFLSSNIPSSPASHNSSDTPGLAPLMNV